MQRIGSEKTYGPKKRERLEPNYDNGEKTDNIETYLKSAGKNIKGLLKPTLDENVSSEKLFLS